MSSSEVTACVIVIGNEILSGRTHDKNTHWLAGKLTELGINVREARVIPDITPTIISTVLECSSRYDYVFTTGGIGPTHDDITAESIAQCFEVALHLHPEAHARLKKHYGVELNEARLKMAYVPQGATLIDNPVSAAPGFCMENVYVMAGIPSIMQAMFSSIQSTLKGGPPTLSKTITGAVTEGIIATELTAIQHAHPQVEIGSYPFMKQGRLGVSLVIRGLDEACIDAAAKEVAALIIDKGELFSDVEQGECVA